MATIIKRMAAAVAAVLVAAAAWAGDYVEVTGTNVRLRQSPTLQGKIYADAKGQPVYPAKGAMLDLTGESGDFYQVSYNGKTLYISKQYTRVVRGSARQAAKGTPAAKRPAVKQSAAGGTVPAAVIVTGKNVRLRSAASLKSPALQDDKGNNIHPAKGARLVCKGAQGDFYKVVYKGLTAYISKQYAEPVR